MNIQIFYISCKSYSDSFHTLFLCHALNAQRYISYSLHSSLNHGLGWKAYLSSFMLKASCKVVYFVSRSLWMKKGGQTRKGYFSLLYFHMDTKYVDCFQSTSYNLSLVTITNLREFIVPKSFKTNLSKNCVAKYIDSFSRWKEAYAFDNWLMCLTCEG